MKAMVILLGELIVALAMMVLAYIIGMPAGIILWIAAFGILLSDEWMKYL